MNAPKFEEVIKRIKQGSNFYAWLVKNNYDKYMDETSLILLVQEHNNRLLEAESKARKEEFNKTINNVNGVLDLINTNEEISF